MAIAFSKNTCGFVEGACIAPRDAARTAATIGIVYFMFRLPVEFGDRHCGSAWERPPPLTAFQDRGIAGPMLEAAVKIERDLGEPRFSMKVHREDAEMGLFAGRPKGRAPEAWLKTARQVAGPEGVRQNAHIRGRRRTFMRHPG